MIDPESRAESHTRRPPTDRSERSFYERFVKRPIDILGASIGLVVASPIMLLTAVAVRFTMGSPVLFRQVRPGRNEELFTLLKFRTMREPELTADGSIESGEKRLTKLGAILRSTSLDELPQMVNIIKGDMSFIGPRPLLVSYLRYYTETEKVRHRVRPGITGLAQVRGRNTVQWDKRFAYDVEYVNSLTASMDARIAWETVSTVIRRKNIIVSGAGSELSLTEYRRDMHSSSGTPKELLPEDFP